MNRLSSPNGKHVCLAGEDPGRRYAGYRCALPRRGGLVCDRVRPIEDGVVVVQSEGFRTSEWPPRRGSAGPDLGARQ